MGGQYGVQNLVELMKLGFSLGGAVKGALADGKLGLDDLALLMPAVQHVGPAFDDLDKAPKEWAELDAEDAAALMAAGRAELAGVPESHLKDVVGKSLKVALVVGELVSVLKQKDAPPPAAA